MNRCATHGLNNLFLPHDLRRPQSSGLWPALDMVKNPAKLEAAMVKLLNCLVADSYGGVRALRGARDVYNSRLVSELVSLEFKIKCRL